MNCQIILENDIHEKYLLDRLEGHDKSDYLHHINECLRCQKDFEAERILISGIRHTGREHMKKEIQQQVESLRNRTGTNWARISRIAAVIFFLVMTPSVIYFLQRQEPQSVPGSIELLSEKPGERADFYAEEEVIPESKESRVPVLSAPRALVTEKKGSGQSESADRVSDAESVVEKRPVEMQEQLGEASGSKTVGEAKRRQAKDISIVQGKSRFLLDESAIRRAESNTPKRVAQGEKKSSFLVRTYSYKPREEQLSQQENEQAKTRAKLLSKKSETPSAASLRFVSDGHFIDISFSASVSKTQFSEKGQGELPKSFPVEIVSADSMRIAMIWQIPSDVSYLHDDDLKLELRLEDRLLFFVGKATYRIDLNRKMTEAVLVE